MGKGKRTCRVCGKVYDYCKPAYTDTVELYRWQDVACCVEHGAEYFALVNAARSENEKPSDERATVVENATTATKGKDDAAGRKKNNKSKSAE